MRVAIPCDDRYRTVPQRFSIHVRLEREQKEEIAMAIEKAEERIKAITDFLQ